MRSWKTHSRKVVFQPNDGRWLTVEDHSIELPDGQLIEGWLWLRAPDYVIVAAFTETGQLLCFRQTKYAVDGVTLAPPGGYIETGEDPLLAAQRELLEETGYQAPEWNSLGSFVVDGNRGFCTAHLYLARGARWVQPIDADDLEEQELLLLDRKSVQSALDKGKFRAIAWTTAIALALLHVEDSYEPSS
ncbi:NUDIX hydrolase [Chloroflexi bacterium TSY]|nr:NUDIX hydrolase [Chloroflexi bacterium TSY]